jgi:integrase
VAEDWLDFKKPNIRHNTWVKYDGYVRNHYDMFLKSKINRITTAKVEKFISKKQLNGMNITTLRKLIVALNQIMKYAVRHQYMETNPVTNAERPKDQRTEEDKECIQVLTEDQIFLLLENVEEYEFKVLFQLALFSGARQSELFGLMWSDIDWENSQIEIRRNINGGKWYSPKSKASKRKIDIGPLMLSELKKWRLKSVYSKSDDLVFPNYVGKPLASHNVVRKYFHPALKKAKLPVIRFHDLRHTFASHLLDLGENVVYVSKQLGHASPVVTLTIYAHLINPINMRAAAKLEEKVFKNYGKKMVRISGSQKNKGLANEG